MKWNKDQKSNKKLWNLAKDREEKNNRTLKFETFTTIVVSVHRLQPYKTMQEFIFGKSKQKQKSYIAEHSWDCFCYQIFMNIPNET